MRKSRHAKEQIVGILKESEVGWRRRSLAVSTGSASTRSTLEKATFDGLEVANAQRLRQLERRTAS
jgi:hypothetical protein